MNVLHSLHIRRQWQTCSKMPAFSSLHPQTEERFRDLEHSNTSHSRKCKDYNSNTDFDIQSPKQGVAGFVNRNEWNGIASQF